MLLSYLLKPLMILRRRNDEQNLWATFICKAHGFQLHALRGRGSNGLHIIYQAIVGNMPFTHFVIYNILWFWNSSVIGNTIGKIIAKILCRNAYGKKDHSRQQS